MATAEKTMLADFIADEVGRCNGTVDAAEVAQRIMPQLERGELEQLAWGRVRSLVVDWIAAQRPPATKRSNGRPRSLLWEEVNEVRDILDDWYVAFTDRPSKHLLDCSPTDLADAAEWYESRAEGYLARAGAYRKLAKEIGRKGGSTVADLPRETVRGILDA